MEVCGVYGCGENIKVGKRELRRGEEEKRVRGGISNAIRKVINYHL